jgi:hypothetical protein
MRIGMLISEDNLYQNTAERENRAIQFASSHDEFIQTIYGTQRRLDDPDG